MIVSVVDERRELVGGGFLQLLEAKLCHLDVADLGQELENV